MKELRYTVFSGLKLKEYLSRIDLTYVDAGKEANVDKNTISNVVRGRNVSVNSLLKICNSFNFPVHQFFYEKEISNNTDPSYNIGIKEYEEASEAPLYTVRENIEKYNLCENDRMAMLEKKLMAKEEQIKILNSLISNYKNQIEDQDREIKRLMSER